MTLKMEIQFKYATGSPFFKKKMLKSPKLSPILMKMEKFELNAKRGEYQLKNIFS